MYCTQNHLFSHLVILSLLTQPILQLPWVLIFSKSYNPDRGKSHKIFIGIEAFYVKIQTLLRNFHQHFNQLSLTFRFAMKNFFLR